MAESITDYLNRIIIDKRVLEEINATMIRGAINSGEADDSQESITAWFNMRFKPNSVVLDKDDYSRALIRSLWIAPNLAALDFAGGRLRDFAQLWTDTARGFLGEIAVQKFFKINFQADMYLETRRGNVEEFMPSDVLIIDKDSAKPRKSKIRVSIKTTKLNGRWLEVPESQFKQSDVFVFVKLGISRYHFSSYLKKTIEQLINKGLELKELDEEQIKILSNEIPEWSPIPAYISGFVDKDGLNSPIDKLSFRTPKKQKKNAEGIRPISKIDIEGGVGLFSEESVRGWGEVKAQNIPLDVPISIAGIGKEADGNFYASSGLLTFKKADWEKLIRKL